jgi:hypothetical protein
MLATQVTQPTATVVQASTGAPGPSQAITGLIGNIFNLRGPALLNIVIIVITFGGESVGHTHRPQTVCVCRSSAISRSNVRVHFRPQSLMARHGHSRLHWCCSCLEYS